VAGGGKVRSSLFGNSYFTVIVYNPSQTRRGRGAVALRILGLA